MIFGQELNPQTYAIAKADTLIKGYNASNMKQGDTLDNDQFGGYTFDYIISNPPFGIDWKSEEKAVKEEYTKTRVRRKIWPRTSSCRRWSDVVYA
ncbi:MAG: SAM-dependent methyltransferase [Clostridiales bacterium]|nr:MAG: SAM-dependent methyltransferase [Clostridiales bacterium]